MKDEANVGLVDSHSEGVGADHHADFPAFPGRLPLRAGPGAESGVVEGGGDAFLPEKRGEFLGLFTVADIDYSGAWHGLADADYLAELVFRMAHDVGEVRTLESALYQKLLTEAQAGHDVVGDGRGGCGRNGNHGGIDAVAELSDVEVVRAEVIAPLGDAVRLIDDDVGEVHVPEVLPEEARGETLGGYVEELVVAVGGVVEGEIDVAFRHAGIDGYGADAPVAQVLDLVLHQGYERGDDKGKPRLHHGRNLKADGFAAAGWEDCEHVTAFHRRLHNFLLLGAEAVVAPIFLQNLSCCHHMFFTG